MADADADAEKEIGRSVPSDDTSSASGTIRSDRISSSAADGAGGSPPKGAPPESTSSSSPDTAVAPEEGRTSLETALIITALSSALFLAALDMTIVTVAIPTIAQEFNSTIGYTWIGSAYMLASASLAPMWGKISDIWGRKPIMLVAVGIFWIGSLLCALSRSMGMLIAVRAIQGVGGGGIIILVNICISDLFSMRRRGKHALRLGHRPVRKRARMKLKRRC